MQYMGLLIPIVAIVSVFTFVAIATWSDSRRKERETFHLHETYRRMLEQPGKGAEEVLALMRQQEAREAESRIEGLKLGGLITAAVGVGLFFLLKGVEPDKMLWGVALIPLLIGVVLAVYAFFLAPRPARSDPRA
jgi:preprotein translocase subunit YajC